MSEPSRYAVPYTTKRHTRGFVTVWASDLVQAVLAAEKVHGRSIRLYRYGQARGVQMRLRVRERPIRYGEPVAVTEMCEEAWAAWRVEALKVG